MSISSNRAFPGIEQLPGVASRTEHHPGMTIRQYYAAIAMQSILSNTGKSLSPEVVARESLAYADALIRELGDY